MRGVESNKQAACRKGALGFASARAPEVHAVDTAGCSDTSSCTCPPNPRQPSPMAPTQLCPASSQRCRPLGLLGRPRSLGDDPRVRAPCSERKRSKHVDAPSGQQLCPKYRQQGRTSSSSSPSTTTPASDHGSVILLFFNEERQRRPGLFRNLIRSASRTRVGSARWTRSKDPTCFPPGQPDKPRLAGVARRFSLDVLNYLGAHAGETLRAVCHGHVRVHLVLSSIARRSVSKGQHRETRKSAASTCPSDARGYQAAGRPVRSSRMDRPTARHTPWRPRPRSPCGRSSRGCGSAPATRTRPRISTVRPVCSCLRARAKGIATGRGGNKERTLRMPLLQMCLLSFTSMRTSSVFISFCANILTCGRSDPSPSSPEASNCASKAQRTFAPRSPRNAARL